MQEQKKSNVTYWLNGETVSKEEFSSLVGEYFKYFDSGSVKAVDYSFIENLFDGEHKSQRQINDHLKGVLGGKFKKSVPDKTYSTRHKAKQEGRYHKYPLTPDECFSLNSVDKNCNKAQERFLESILDIPKPTTFNQSDFFDKKQQEQEILDTFKRNMEGIKESEGKLNYELDWGFIQQIAERMSQNKGKYEPYNWTKPMDVEKLKQSLFRHVIEVMKGNYLDDGREFGHLESIALNAMMINYQLKSNV